MRDLPRDADFIVESRQSIGIGRSGLGQKFQRDLLAQPKIGGAIYFAHAAAAEQSEDAIALGDQGARKKRPSSGESDDPEPKDDRDAPLEPVRGGEGEGAGIAMVSTSHR